MMRSTAPISDFTIGIYDGPHATPKPSDDGPIFLGIKNVTVEGRLDFENIRHVSEAEFPRWTRRVKPQKDDIVFSYEATLHRYARIPDEFEGCLGRRMALVRPDLKKVDPRFLHYYFLSPLWRSKMDAITISGATVDRIPLTKFPHVCVSLPGLNEQVAIANILTSYDDLIENSRRRITLLEEAARLLYREWFVHFRFPGYAHVKFTDGVPEGWAHRSVSCLADVIRGRSYRSFELADSDGQPFINLKCMMRLGGFRTSGLKWFCGEHKERHAAGPGDILIAVTDITRNAMIVAQAARVPRSVGENAVYSMDLVKAIPRHEIEPEWLYGMFRFSGFSAAVREEATGATVLHLKPKHIENWKALVPPTVLRSLFVEQYSDILKKIDVLEIQRNNCAQARDLLLPRLMNGQIAV